MPLLPSLASPTPPRAARVARRTLLVAAVVVAALSLSYALLLLTDDTRPLRTYAYRAAVVGDEFLLAAPVSGGFAGDEIAVRYSVREGPVEVAIFRQGDLPALLRGADVRPLKTLTPDPVLGGFVVRFERIAATCPPPTGGCIESSIPIIVWRKGTAWIGTQESALAFGRVEHERGLFTDTLRGEAPMTFGIDRTSRLLVQGSRAVVTGAALGALVAAGAAVAWIVIERRARLTPSDPPAPHPPDVATESLLALVHLRAVYLDTIRRHYAFSAFGIVFLAAASMYAGLPPVLLATYGHLAWFGYEPSMILFVALVPFLAVVAFVHWGVAFARVRRDLVRWNGLSQRFETEAARLLER